MRWEDCYTNQRSGTETSTPSTRTDYQRDFDRLIFASSFRRLQNKTQVFPLPGSTFVHNRLTHSLEVSSVGRSLGAIVGSHLASYDISADDTASQDFYFRDLPSVIAAACLAHDIGNPAFGHSGEKAIANYFIEHAETVIEGRTLREHFSSHEWQDLITFEGNANALRVMTHPYRDKPKTGMGLTYTTLASIIKYPCSSTATDKAYKHRKKYGFFKTEESTFQSIADTLQMEKEQDQPIIYKRHPFVYLVEAADDICYRIIDLEDAQRLGIVSKNRAAECLLSILEQLNKSESDKIHTTYKTIRDANDSIAYLRAKTINLLTELSAQCFIDNKDDILAGTYVNTLIDQIEESTPALADLVSLSIKEIYRHHSVIEIEITGYHVMSHLLSLFVPAVLREQKVGTDRMALNLIPYQFTEYEKTDSSYLKAMSVVDFISGMTDSYATEFYRKTTGIDISKHV